MIKTVEGRVILRVPVADRPVSSDRNYEKAKAEQQTNEDLAQKILALEQWLNLEVAKQAYELLQTGLRVHLDFPGNTTRRESD
jgi:hypothetical protein